MTEILPRVRPPGGESGSQLALFPTFETALPVEPPIDWDEWCSPSALRNWCLNDTLLDWLQRYGRANGFVPDHERPGFDADLDFALWVARKGEEFEAAVIALISHRLETRVIAGGGFEEVRSPERAAETLAAMHDGVPVIAQAVLRDPLAKTFGAADLLVRSDMLDMLIPGAIPAGERTIVAPILGGAWHYRAIDIKFTNLPLDRTGCVQPGEKLGYVLQVALYNRMLGRLQGYEPPAGYLLGRGWNSGTGKAAARSLNCFDRLGEVRPDRLYRGQPVSGVLDDALAWVRNLRAEGSKWQVLPRPSVAELWPNLKNRAAQPWSHATREIGAALGDITEVWGAGLPKRRTAFAAGIESWRDPRCTSGTLGITGEVDAPLVDRILEANRPDIGPAVLPARVTADEAAWRPRPALEFFVDFETVNALDDDFTRLPQQNATALIFMVGCGHMENGAWQFANFVADRLDPAAEGEMLSQWFAHMEAVTMRLAPGTRPNVLHWSPAETSSFETAYNSARSRHPYSDWPDIAWFDFLKRVIKAEPVVVRGAMAFGLKAVAKAMHRHGLIATNWTDGPVDGLGAMVSAWRASEECRISGQSLRETPLMRGVAAYNEVDCRVMMEVVDYLRSHH